MFKKSLAFLMATVLCGTIALTGCSQKKETTEDTPKEEETTVAEETETESQLVEPTAEIKVASLKGPTTMGMVKLIEDANQNENSNYNFTIAGTPDEVVALLAKGEIDAAAIPANLAAILYNKKGLDISVAAVNTLGVLYIVDSSGNIKEISDLSGQTVLATGKGTVPEYTIRHILNANGINPDTDVDLQFKSEPTEVLSLLKSGEASVAMLPQPFATSAMGAVENLNIALDLTAEWDKVSPESSVVTGVVVVRNDYVKENKESLDTFLSEYKKSTEYVNANAADAATLVEKYNIAPAKIAEKAIPKCNITFVEGEEMQSILGGFLDALFQQNPDSIGGKLPDESFFYQK